MAVMFASGSNGRGRRYTGVCVPVYRNACWKEQRICCDSCHPFGSIKNRLIFDSRTHEPDVKICFNRILCKELEP